MCGFLKVRPGFIQLDPKWSSLLNRDRLKIWDDDCQRMLFDGSADELIQGVRVHGGIFVWLAKDIDGIPLEFERAWVPEEPKILTTPKAFVDELSDAIGRIIS